MKALLLEAAPSSAMEPLTCTRSLGECLIANRPLVSWQRQTLAAAGFVNDDASADLACWQMGNAWLAAADAAELAKSEVPVSLVDGKGDVLAWVGGDAETQPEAKLVATGSRLILYPWELLDLNDLVLGELETDRVEGVISDGVHLEGYVELGEGSRILPGVYIEGNVSIGRNCKIGPNCYLRGSTSIGDGCHIGQSVEVKNSIVMPGSAIGHLSYCGDSIIGTKVNFGAGTIISNFRHDGKNHRSMVDGVLVDTGRRKFGTIMGDGVHTGIHTSIYPGRKIWPGCMTRPGTVVQQDLRS
jgi:bifunctional UDP-N-acetylglucosamine pyrophosphorylase/glucosamine-1-phosphate N-acetyltransferase